MYNLKSTDKVTNHNEKKKYINVRGVYSSITLMITSRVTSQFNSIFPSLYSHPLNALNALNVSNASNALNATRWKGSSLFSSCGRQSSVITQSYNTNVQHDTKTREAILRAVEYPSTSFNNYEFHPLIYTGEIGQVSDYTPRIITLHPSQEDVIRQSPDLYMYKYGITSNIQRRVRENNRQFKYFDVKLLKGSIRHMEIEKCITNELKVKRLLLNIMVNGKTRREIICFSEEWQKEWYVQLIDDLIRKQYKNHKFVNKDWLNDVKREN
mgnify:CR=1 FL=1